MESEPNWLLKYILFCCEQYRDFQKCIIIGKQKPTRLRGQPMVEVIKYSSSIINITGMKRRMVIMCVNFDATTKFIMFDSPCLEA